jgi:hypothetical protein
MNSEEEMTKTKIIGLKDFYKFIVDDILIRNSYYLKILFKVLILKFHVSNYSNKVRWKKITN